MAILDILTFPDPRLRTIAKPVEVFDDSLQQLVDDMIETMYDAQGVGLAATQVDVHLRVVVIDTSENSDSPQVFINPTIETNEGPSSAYNEGCLSVPGIYEDVKRPENIVVRAYDVKGEQFELEPDGLLAVCIQHELDHLNGKLFIDYVSAMKRSRIRKKVEKQQRLSAK